MPNEYALIGLVHLVMPDKRIMYGDSAPVLPGTERVGARLMRARTLRAVARRTVKRVRRRLRRWRRRMAETDELRAMSDRELRDFGISRYDAAHEAKQTFSRAYREHW